MGALIHPCPPQKPHLLLRQATSHMYITNWLPIGLSQIFPSSAHATAWSPRLSNPSSAVSLRHFSIATWNESLGCRLLPRILDWILNIVYMDILGLAFDTERLYRKETGLVPWAFKCLASEGAMLYLASTTPHILSCSKRMPSVGTIPPKEFQKKNNRPPHPPITACWR